jgi:DNA-binding MarR family transcriptional regulator
LLEFICAAEWPTAYERAAYMVLVRHCRFVKNGPGKTHVGAKRLALESGQSIRQVRRSLKSLEERGLIQVERVFVDHKQRTNTYSLVPANARTA